MTKTEGRDESVKTKSFDFRKDRLMLSSFAPFYTHSYYFECIQTDKYGKMQYTRSAQILITVKKWNAGHKNV